MTLDVRTRVYCNLGEVISGRIQDGSVVGAGLVASTGSVVLSGVYRVRDGQTVELAYYKQGRMARLGRTKYQVISSFANPLTRQTEVSFGCRLAVKANSSPPPQKVTADDDDETDDLTGIQRLLMRKPIKAKHIVRKICDKLKIDHDPIPLTNEFYRESFDISGPYLQVVSDLLVSEGYVGFMNASNKLDFKEIKTGSNQGPILSEDQIIDVSPIVSGEPDADVVYSIVRYTKIKLDRALTEDTGETDEEILVRNDIPADDEDVQDIINDVSAVTPEDQESQDRTIRSGSYTNPYWLRDFVDNGTASRTFSYQAPRLPGDTEQAPLVTQTLSWGDTVLTETKYDSDGRVKRTITTTNTLWGPQREVTTYDYKRKSGTETVTQIQRRYVPGDVIVEACGFPSEVLPSLPGNIRSIRQAAEVLYEEITTVNAASNDRVIQRVYSRRVAVATSAGAASIQAYLKSFEDRAEGDVTRLRELLTLPVLAFVVRSAAVLQSENTRVSFSTKQPDARLAGTAPVSSSGGSSNTATSGFDYDSLSPEEQDDLLNRELDAEESSDPAGLLPSGVEVADTVTPTNPSNGWTTQEFDVPEILFDNGSNEGIMVELTPPYMSDDKVVKSGLYYSVVPSDAKQKSLAFARTQNRLRFGYRNGQAVVYPIEYAPIRPFSPVYLKMAGVVGQYRTDQTTIEFDNTGILVSTDMIFWGGVGK